MVYTISWFKSQQGAGVILPETIGDFFLYFLTMLLLTFSYLTQLSQWLRWSLKHDHWSGSLIRPWCVATSNWKSVGTNVKRDLTPASTCCAEPHPWVPCQRLYSSLMEREVLSPLVPLHKVLSSSHPWLPCTSLNLGLKKMARLFAHLRHRGEFPSGGIALLFIHEMSF